MLKRTLTSILAFLLMSGPPLANGVDCWGTLSTQEQLICKEPDLQASDYRMNALYSVVLQVSPTNGVKATQRQWLRTQRARCLDSTCLMKAYQERNDDLMDILRRGADPVPMDFYAEVKHKATKSHYCRISGATGGDWFVVEGVVDGQSISGSIDGVFDCGRKVWGGVGIAGKVTNNIAIVRFQPGFSKEQDPLAEALVLVKRKRVYWRVLTEYSVESYVPQAEMARMSARPPDYESDPQRY